MTQVGRVIADIHLNCKESARWNYIKIDCVFVILHYYSLEDLISSKSRSCIWNAECEILNCYFKYSKPLTYWIFAFVYTEICMACWTYILFVSPKIRCIVVDAPTSYQCILKTSFWLGKTKQRQRITETCCCQLKQWLIDSLKILNLRVGLTEVDILGATKWK